MFRSVQERRRNRARKRLTFELLESRRLLAAVDWTGNAGNGLWSDPANWSSAAVPDFDDDVTINVAGNATVVLQGVQSVRSLVNHETLVLQGNNTQGAAVLQVSESSANSGVVELVSLSSNGNYGAQLDINDDALFTNQTGAELRVLAGSGSYRQLGGNGDFINEGVIEIETGIHLRSVMAVGASFRQQSGTISGSGGFNLDGVDFQFVGGSIATTLDARLRGSSLTFATTIVAPADLVIEGIGNSLLTDIPSGVSVTIEGNSQFGQAVLMIPEQSEVSGSLVLTSTSSNGNYGATLTIDPAGELTLAAEGLIQSLGNGLNGRAITGPLVNRGSIVETGPGAIGYSGHLTSDGGTYSGDFYAQNTDFHFGADAPIDSRLTLMGIGNTVSSDVAAGYILEVQANSLIGSATLALTSSIANLGQIELVSTSTNNNYTANLQADAGLTFTNATAGTVNVLAGAGSSRYLFGGGQFINDGLIHIEAGSRLRTSVAAGTVIRQQDGEISGSGGFNFDALDFQFVGGSIATTLDGRLNGSTLSFGESVPAPAELIVEGIYNSLLTDIPSGVSVTIEGNSAIGAAVLTVPGLSEVSGSILLTSTSVNGNFGAQVQIDPVGELTIASGGLLQSIGNGINGRTVNGTLVNRGSIVETGPGAIDYSGHLTSDGGTYSGDFYAQNTDFHFGADAPIDSRLTLMGIGNTVSSDVAAGYILEVQANSLIGSATLALTSSIANHGQIELVSTSTNNNYTANLQADAGLTFTNATDGTVNVLAGAGSLRYLFGGGQFINDGLIHIEAGARLRTSVAAGTVIRQQDGEISGNGGFNFDALDFQFVGGSIATSLDGRLNGSTLSFGVSVPAPAELIVEGIYNSLLTDIPSGVSVTIEGNSAIGAAVLTVPGQSEVQGSLVLTSTSSNGNYGATLTIDPAGELTLAADGLIQSLGNGLNGRAITGPLVNRGSIVESGPGAINYSGQLTSDGGSYSGDFVVRTSNLLFGASVPFASRLTLVNLGNQVLTNIAAGYVLEVQGNGDDNAAQLAIPQDTINHGRIELVSTTSNTNYYPYLELINNSTFRNSVDGRIQVLGTINTPRAIHGNGTVINEGRITIDEGLNLDLNPNSTFTFFQRGGFIAGQGGINFRSLDFDYLGGSISHTLDVRAENTRLSFSDRIIGPTTIVTEGSNELLSNVPRGVTINVEGNNVVGGANLNVAQPVLISGTLQLSTKSSNGNYYPAINTIADGVVEIAPSGLLHVLSGTANIRQFNGHLVNAGRVVEVGETALIFTGRLDSNGGIYVGDILVNNSELYFQNSPEQSSALMLVGGNNLLSSDLTSGYELLVTGTAGGGEGILNTVNGVTNHGRIVLDSTANYDSRIFVENIDDRDFFNGPTGTIESLIGSGGVRYLSGKLHNYGTVAIDRVLGLLSSTGTAHNYGNILINVANPGSLGLSSAGGLISHGPFGVLSGNGTATTQLSGVFDISLPALSGLQHSGTEITLKFASNGGLDQTSAENIAHYGLREAGPDGVIGNSDDLVADNLIRSASYDNVAETVTLQLATALPAGDYLLDIAADLIEDTNGAAVYLEPYALRLTVADVAAIERMDAENLLLNGSFELVAWDGVAPTTDAPIVVLAEKATDIRGWQIIPGDSGGTLDWVGPAHFTASAGDYSVDLSGTPGLGGIQQTVRTRPGTRYHLQFDMGGNPYGNLLDPIEPPLKTLEVFAAGQTQVFEHELSSAATANSLGWVKKSWEFVAVDEWTTLSFRGLGPEGSLFGATLDNVRLSISDNLLVNGGFENRNPLDFTAVPLPDAAAPIVTIPGGSLIVAGWETVVQSAGDSLDWVDNSHFQAAEGQRSLDLNGTPGRGGVKQSFATEVGQEYELQFQFAGNPRGIALDPQADPFKAVEVQIAGQTLQFDLTVNQSGDPFVPHWQQRTVKFTATEPMTTVQFLSLAPDTTGPSSNYGPTLDDVVVRKVNNLVVNGSFEVADDAGLAGLPGSPSEPPSHAAPIYVLPQGSTALSGWTIAGVSAEDTVDWVHQTHVGASTGLRSVDLNGTPGLGSVSQTIATEVGRTYVISFDLAGNPYGNGTNPVTDPVKRIAVTVGGETLEYAHLVRGSDSALRPGWQRYTTQFTATSAATLLRFASLAPDLCAPAGSGDYGAMLDNVVVFHADYGDLPNSYATLHSADGARHLAQGAMLGTGRDFEGDGQPGPDALLDGWDEDGVFIPTMQPGDTTAWMEVRVSQADIGQQLDAWIDFNADGDWDEPGEQVASAITVVEGLNRIYFAVPTDAVIGDAGARIRLSSESLGTPTGLANDGEVEDYLARIDAPGSIAGVLWNDLNSNAVRDSVLVGGDDPDLVIVIDVSGSTSDSFAGSSVGDLNGDGVSDTILDAEIAGVYAILDYLIAEGKGQTSQVSIVTFSSGSTLLDLNPVAVGLQASATPEADVDNNGVADIRQQIATIFSSGGTDFAAGLGTAKQAVDLVGTLRENANVIFMSDGVGQWDFGGALQLLRDRVSTIRAFGVGAGSSLDQLRQIDANTIQFSTTDELIDAFSGFGSESLFAEPGIPGWEIYLDLNGNGQPDANEPRTRTSTDDPSTFANEAGKFRFDGLAAGTYIVRQVLPSGWWQTYPGLDADQAHTVVVVGGEVTEAVDFGVVFNQLPQAISDEVTVQWGSNATFDTRSNDFDPNGGPLTIRGVTNAANGTLEINNGQSITYTPAVGFSGVDSFTYTISDANGLQSTSTVTVILNGPATDLIFHNAVTDLNENIDNSSGTLLAELEVVDDGLGTNYLSLSGADAAFFELIGNQLWLKAGVVLDHEVQASFEVDIDVDDPEIGSSPDLTRPFVLTVNDLAEVVDVQFGDGTLQRSNVSQVVVTFDGVVDLGAGAFVLTERSSGTEVTTSVTTSSGPNGETIAQLIFSGDLTRNGGNLLDGNYRLQINATDVTRDGQEMDGDRDGVVGGDLVRGETAEDAFFALFGDGNGDRTIGFADFLQFRSTFGSSSPGENYDGRFDFDDDEVIGFADFLQFRSRFGTSLDF